MRYLIGVAWPYANGSIHLGHVAGCYLPSDIFHRFQRLRGNEVWMVSGSDMHGTPITVTAEAEGTTPDVIAKRYHEINSKNMKDLGISFTLFFETIDPHHHEVVQDLFLKNLQNGYIYKDTQVNAYCDTCSRFLPDRYVEGTCPHCNFDSARGDQCDDCGKTLDPSDLISPACKLCGSKPEMKETEHFFLKLSAFEDRLKEYVRSHKEWKRNTKAFTLNWLESGLKDRAITRDIKWGIKIPVDGYDDKRIYVWFDAVTGYFSTSKEHAKRIGKPDRWKEFWQSDECKHYYFLGKDNIPFHTIIWPAMLMGYGGLNIPDNVVANEYLRFKGEQFSKSRGHAVWIPDFLAVFEADLLRYYLCQNMPEHRDADFTWEDFQRRINNELVATFGNYCHRVLTFTRKNFGTVPGFKGTKEQEEEATSQIRSAEKAISKALDDCEFKTALGHWMALAKFGNQYFDKVAPWSLMKKDKEACGTVLNLNLRVLKALCIMGEPFLPFSMERLWDYMGYEGSIHEQKWDDALTGVEEGQELKQPTPLYKEVTKEMTDSVGNLPSLDWVDLKIGRIVEIDDHPNADKLYVMKIDLGKETRQLVAGLKPYYPKEEMLNREICVVCNLKPAKLRGVESNGMLLAADDGKGVVSLLTPKEEVPEGTGIQGAHGSDIIDFGTFTELDLAIGEYSGGKLDNGAAAPDADIQKADEGELVAGFFLSDGRGVAPLVTGNGVPLVPQRKVDKGAKIR